MSAVDTIMGKAPNLSETPQAPAIDAPVKPPVPEEIVPVTLVINVNFRGADGRMCKGAFEYEVPTIAEHREIERR